MSAILAIRQLHTYISISWTIKIQGKRKVFHAAFVTTKSFMKAPGTESSMVFPKPQTEFANCEVEQFYIADPACLAFDFLAMSSLCQACATCAYRFRMNTPTQEVNRENPPGNQRPD